MPGGWRSSKKALEEATEGLKGWHKECERVPERGTKMLERKHVGCRGGGTEGVPCRGGR